MPDMKQNVRLKVRRQDNPRSLPYWDEFEVPYVERMNIVTCLMSILRNPVNVRGEKVAPVVWECNCLEEVCGACTMVINGTVRQADIVRAFDIRPLALKRWVKRYRTQGPRAFFETRRGGSKPRVLTPEMREKVQSRLDQGQRPSEISTERGLSYDVLRKAIGDGRLKKPEKKTKPSSKQTPQKSKR